MTLLLDGFLALHDFPIVFVVRLPCFARNDPQMSVVFGLDPEICFEREGVVTNAQYCVLSSSGFFSGFTSTNLNKRHWVPACAGMTVGGVKAGYHTSRFRSALSAQLPWICHPNSLKFLLPVLSVSSSQFSRYRHPSSLITLIPILSLPSSRT